MTDPAADPLRNVEPTADFRSFGFAQGDRPPAPWHNHLLHTAGQCFEYLFGTKTGNWSVHGWGALATLDLAKPISGDADDDTVSATGAPFARVVVGGVEDSGTDTQLRVSADGEVWFERLPTHGGGTPITDFSVLFWTGGHWLIGENAVGVGAIWRTASGATTGSGILDDANDWNATTLPASTAGLKAFAVQDLTHLAAVATNKPIYSTNDGNTWSNASLSAGATGDSTDVCWTGSAWLAITDDGEIYRAAAGLAGTWTKLGTDLPDKAWRLEAGPDGYVLAYPYLVGGTDDWYVSTDHGATWTLQTAPSGFQNIYRIRYDDGAWLAAVSDASTLWQATGTDADLWVVVRLDAVDDGGAIDGTDVRDVARVGDRYVTLGNLHAHRTPRAEGLDPGAFVATALAATLRDAAYLRGNVVSGTSPADRDVLEWDDAAKEWTPTGAAAWATVKTTATSYVVAANVASVQVTDTSAPRQITLPTPALGRRVTVIDVSGGASGNTITVKDVSASISGTTSYDITTDYGAVTVESDGTDWFVIAAVT